MPKIATPQSRLGIEFSSIVSIIVATFFLLHMTYVKYTSTSLCISICVLIHSSLYVLDLMLFICRPNLTGFRHYIKFKQEWNRQ
jgi:hypothetical protein